MKDYFAGIGGGDAVSEVSALLGSTGHRNTLAHCQAVASQARTLARRYGADERQADLAANCHDLAVVVPSSELVLVAEAMGIQLDPTERGSPILLHGAIAAVVLQQRLGIDDTEVLAAVKYHTTCRQGAGLLEKLIFVADKIALDPSASEREFVYAVEAASERSLEEAVLVYLDWVVTRGPRLGWTIHPRVLQARTDILSRGF